MYDIRSEAVPLEGSLGAGRGPKPRRRRTPGANRVPRFRIGVAIAVGLLVLAAGAATPSAVRTTPHAVALPFTGGLPEVESLYSADLVARINAERAARSTPSIPIPSLSVDGGLQTEAQSWSSYLASQNAVEDPPLTTCSGPGGSSPSPGQVCAFAANSGDSGYGFWPGDGSDGMDADYMASSGHRENELGAAYTSVGVGVTCSGNQAFTVELFGYAYGSLSSASSRQYAQNSEGNPVPATPVVAGSPSGDPVYCPGQTYGPNGETTTTGGQFPYPFAVASVPGEPNGASPTTVVGLASTTDGKGYWMATAGGSVTPHGDALNYGSMGGQALNAPIAHIVATSDSKGYWLVASDGGIFSFGDAGFYGSMGGQPLNAPVVGIAPTPDGKGYWLVASDGGVFAFGDAAFEGSMGGQPLNQPVVGMAGDRGTSGYWLVASDGGIFSFDAPFYGSTGSLELNQPVNGMAATGNGSGYWFVASDGGVFSFGDADFHGSAGDLSLAAPIVGIAADHSTGGYWLVGADGGVFAYDAGFFGT
ncbi:MAG: CAP domain-containing protein [Acidimicrobiales bacterium]